MVTIGSLVRRVFPHRTWPYPRGAREVHHVIVMALVIVGIVLAGSIVGLKYEDDKTLGPRDVYFAAKNIESYSNEAYLVATHTQAQPIVEPYREVYVQQLADNVDDVKSKLTIHESADGVHLQVTKLIRVCDQLSALLAAFQRDSSDRVIVSHAGELRQLAARAKAIEDSL